MPVLSVDTEEEARALLVMTCSTNIDREFIARELAQEQTLENLQQFSDRLYDAYNVMKRKIRKKPERKTRAGDRKFA